jgi:Family of unknown function (DUF5324)
VTSRAETARKQAENLTEKLAPYAATARESATHAAEEAREWAGPKLEHAREWSTPRIEHVRERVDHDLVPKVAGAVATALAAAEPVREEAKTRGAAALAALKGELEPPRPRRRRHPLRKLLLFTALGAALAAAWKAWQSKSAGTESTWSGGATSTPADTAPTATGPSLAEPIPAPTTAPTTGATTGATATAGGVVGTHPSADDTAAASPDEALADEAAAQEASAVPGETDVPTVPSAAEDDERR